MRISPKNDFAFSFVFGRDENNDLLLSLLNAILGKTTNEPITALAILNPELLPSMIGQKSGRLDIRALTSDGRHVNVEMQLVNQYNMEKRTLFYWGQMMQTQLPEGKDYGVLPKTITINILDFFYTSEPHYHTIYHLREATTLERLTDLLEVHFIELPKFRIAEGYPLGDLEKWLIFLNDPKMREVIRMNEPLIEKACGELGRIQMDPAARRLYELRDLAIRDEKSLKAGAIAEGKELGKAENQREIARKMLELGIELALISEATGLTLKTLEALRND